MKINKLSDNFSPIDEGIFFAIDTEGDTPAEIIVEIIDTESNEIVGTQLLREVTSAKINIAPYLNRFDNYAPMTLRQTTLSEAPTAAYKIRINDIESEEVAVSVNRCKIGTMPIAVTSFPLSRRVAYGEKDELLIVTKKGDTIYAEVESDTGETLHLEHLSLSGVATLTLSPEDFESDVSSLKVTLYCDGEEFCTVRYSVKPQRKGATRMAWISDSGAIEYYTFPLSHKTSHSVEKQAVLTHEGFCSVRGRSKETNSLSSRFEPSATIAALAQITSAPKVWLERNGAYELVEVETYELEYNLFGEPSQVILNVCRWQKEVALW